MEILEEVEVYAWSMAGLVNAEDKIIETFSNTHFDYAVIDIDHSYDCFGVANYRLSYFREETEQEVIVRETTEKIRLEQEKNKRYGQYLKLRKEFETQE